MLPTLSNEQPNNSMQRRRFALPLMLAVALVLVCLAFAPFAQAAPNDGDGTPCVADSTLAAIRNAGTASLYRMDGKLVLSIAEVAEILARAAADSQAAPNDGDGTPCVADSQVQARLFPEPGTDVGYIGRAAEPVLAPAEREGITALVGWVEDLRCGPEDRLECGFEPHYGLVFAGPAATILVLVGDACHTVTFTDQQGKRIGGGILDGKTAARWLGTLERAVGQ